MIAAALAHSQAELGNFLCVDVNARGTVSQLAGNTMGFEHLLYGMLYTADQISHAQFVPPQIQQ